MKQGPEKRPVGNAGAANLFVSANFRRLRMELGSTEAELAETLGLSLQQIENYELGVNQISAGMLFELARAFTIPVEAFFEGLADGVEEDLIEVRRNCHAIIDLTSSRETLLIMENVLRAIVADK